MNSMMIFTIVMLVITRGYLPYRKAYFLGLCKGIWDLNGRIQWNTMEQMGEEWRIFSWMGGTSPRKKRGCHYDFNIIHILMIVVEVFVIQKL